MVEIVALESAPNLTLIGGATQYWRDAQLGVGWEDAVTRHAGGRTLILGRVSPRLLRRVAMACDELHVITRGVPDAAEMAKGASAVTVWCGDPADLGHRTEAFDTVLALADASVLLPLESPSRSWRAVTDDVLSLATPDATVVMTIENDLGTHRIGGLRNPRSADTDADWDPTATWDDSRPRSLAQVREALGEGVLYCVWPTPERVSLLADAEVDDSLHAALAFNAATGTLRGTDPAWLISSFARADRLVDAAPAWLMVRNARTSLPTVERTHAGSLVTGPTEPINGRSALDMFAELAAAEDLPAIRRLIAAWQQATAGDGERTTTGATFGLCTAEPDGDEWIVTPLTTIAETPTAEEQWTALGHLVGVVRDRAWRTPWPSTNGYARILNHLGIMAGLHTVSTARAEKLIPTAPTADDYAQADHGQLVATVTEQEYSIHTLRSKLAWVQLQLNQALEKDAVQPRAVARATGRKASRVAKNGLRSAKGMARRIVG